MLRGLTGTPMRRMHLANNSLADAEPEPLTLANLTTKSLVALRKFTALSIDSSFPQGCHCEPYPDPMLPDREPRVHAFAFSGSGAASPCPAQESTNRNCRMSHAPVGQRSAHRPQCRHTSSSLTITRPVFTGSDTYRSCSVFSAGAVRRVRNSLSSPFRVRVMQSVGQASTQASHSMQMSLVKTVCTSQLRQRCASFQAIGRSNPSSTS